MKVLGIESSCDETAAAVVEQGGRVLSNVIATSSTFFEERGGVLPEEAARRQMHYALPVIREALKLASCSQEEVDVIAVTYGPGLLGSLLVGTTVARLLGALWRKPVIGVHHTFGHLSSTWLHSENPPNIRFPVVTLSASGGHTDLWFRTSHVQGVLLGRTRDDAAGEAFDKGAVLLGLPYPGGPAIARAAEEGDASWMELPLPLHGSDTLDYSFSGLKTALKYELRDREDAWKSRIPDVAASYQEAICQHLVDRLNRAVRLHACNEIHLVGGVSANSRLRSLAQETLPVPVRWPEQIRYCTDNAAMIACAGEFLLQEIPNAIRRDWGADASAPLAAFLQS